MHRIQVQHGGTEIQRQESEGHRLVTYCAGCTGFLGRVIPTFQILDLLFHTDGASDTENSVSRGTTTYINRLLLKLRLASMSRAASMDGSSSGLE